MVVLKNRTIVIEDGLEWSARERERREGGREDGREGERERENDLCESVTT